MSLIKIEREGAVAALRFNHQARRNALGRQLIGELLAALNAFGTEDVRAVILRNDAKHPVWSAGHDVAELPPPGQDPLPHDGLLEQLLRAVQGLRAPVIAMLDGTAWGGACELALTCDMALGDEDASFALTPAKLGLPYNTSGIQRFLARLPLNIVNEMFCTAAPITAARAAPFGLLNLLLPAAELESKTYAMARQIAQHSPQAIGAYKAQAQALAAPASLSAQTFEQLQAVRHAVYTGTDYAEGLRAFAEKRPPVFTQGKG